LPQLGVQENPRAGEMKKKLNWIDRIRILNFLKQVYFRIGIHAAPSGTLFNKIHMVLRKIYRFLSGKSRDISVNKINFQVIKSEPNEIRVLSLCGIGDVLWSLVLIPALLHKYNKQKVVLVVHDPKNHRSGRSVKILERFDYISKIFLQYWPIHQSVPYDNEGHLKYTYTVGEAKGIEKQAFDYALIINTFLEHGLTYEDICTKLNLDSNYLNYDIFSDYKSFKEDYCGYNYVINNCGSNYAVFYMGALIDNTLQGLNRQGLWKVQDWVELARKIISYWNLKIVIVGASYDKEYFIEFIKCWGNNFHENFLNIIGQYNMPETIEILRKARFVIGFASGVPISSTFLGVKTAIFWRPQHLPMSMYYEKSGFDKGFSKSWVPPKMLINNQYIDLWYTIDSPDTIFSKMRSSDW